MQIPHPSSMPRRQLVLAFLTAFILLLLFLHGLSYAYPESAVDYRKGLFKDAGKPWLLLTISNADHLQRRHIIRETWQRYYRHLGVFDTRFVISDPGPIWRPLIEQENKRYNDLIILDHQNEDHNWANRVKSLETFKYIINAGKKYSFVSKVDEDSFIEAKTFWEVFLEPRMTNGTNPHDVFIGRSLQHDYPFKYASGQFYTLSWDLVERLVDAWRTNYITDEHEDVLIGRLLYEARIPYNLTILGLRAAFDYADDATRDDGSAFNRDDVDPDGTLWHGVAVGAINPHQLKSDEHYLKVAACFDENGLNSPRKGIDWSEYNHWVTAGWDDMAPYGGTG